MNLTIKPVIQFFYVSLQKVNQLRIKNYKWKKKD
jgi:hypothetical protein